MVILHSHNQTNIKCQAPLGLTLFLTAPGATGLTARLCAALLPCSLRNCPHSTISGTPLLCGISAISPQPDSQLITIDIAKSSQYSLYILSSHRGHHCLCKGRPSVASSPSLRSGRPHQAKRQHGKKQEKLEPFLFTSEGGRGEQRRPFSNCVSLLRK